MYRILFILSLISAVTPHDNEKRHFHHHHQHHHHRIHHRDRTFEYLAKKVIDVDKKIRELCTENGSNRTVEDYGGNEYKLTVNLPEYNEEELTIKLKHRVLYINAEKKVDCASKVYSEVRVIPVVADLKQAAWYFTDGKLEITFPYQETSKDLLTCDFNIDEHEKSVSKYPDIDVRMGDSSNSTTNDNEGSSLASPEAKDLSNENKV